MIRWQIAFVLSIVCLSAGAWANGGETYCMNYKQLAFVDLEVAKPPFACAALNGFDTMIGNLQKFATRPIIKPSLFVTPDDEQNADYDDEFDHLNFRMGIDKLLRPGALTVMAHEYGHFIFQDYMTDQFPLIAQYGELKKRNNLWFNRVLPIYKSMFTDKGCDAIKLGGDMDAIPQTNCVISVRDAWSIAAHDPDANIEEVLQQFHHKHLDEIYRVLYVTSPYNEMFADLVAVLYDGDTSTITTALTALIPTAPALQTTCRSFTLPLAADFADRDPHCSLSKIRIDFWNKWVLPKLKTESKKQLLDETAKIFAAQAKVQFDRLQPDRPFDAEAALVDLRKALGI